MEANTKRMLDPRTPSRSMHFSPQAPSKITLKHTVLATLSLSRSHTYDNIPIRVSLKVLGDEGGGVKDLSDGF